jgi:predicted GNAT superfamily acetyltransferase
MKRFTIRDLRTYDEMLAVRQLQLEIWGFDDPNTGLYPPVLNTAAKNGGVVLGAFDNESGRMVGFLFGFLGREPGGPFKLCSQAMGILEAWRGQGIAEALKLAQRERILAQELSLITWTFDPLEGPNAHLNLHKLRAIVRTYWRDVYGSNFGQLNLGLPTDRLVAEWWIKGTRLEQAEEPLEWYDAVPILEVEGQGIKRWVARSNLVLEDDLLQLEIPADIHPIKATNMELAYDWRIKVRKAFERYFEKGYIATDFISTVERGQRRNRYILQKRTPDLHAQIGILESKEE